eukprot:2266333-Amphidinium_carterae.1
MHGYATHRALNFYIESTTTCPQRRMRLKTVQQSENSNAGAGPPCAPKKISNSKNRRMAAHLVYHREAECPQREDATSHGGMDPHLCTWQGHENKTFCAAPTRNTNDLLTH